MKRFQLCLLAVFMLLVSNCVSESAMGTTQVHAHFETPQSAINKEHKEALHSHAIQRRAIGSQARIMLADNPDKSEKEEKQVGANGQNSEITGKKQEPLDGQTVSNASPGVPAIGGDSGKKVTSPEGVQPEVQKENKNNKPENGEPPKDGPTQDSSAGGKSAEGGPSQEENVKAKPPADEATTESTTAEPAAEENSTDERSDSTSTSTHSPTETLRDADSQSSVKAGVSSFIFGIGIVLAIYI